jgi:hypothetical protein
MISMIGLCRVFFDVVWRSGCTRNRTPRRSMITDSPRSAASRRRENRCFAVAVVNRFMVDTIQFSGALAKLNLTNRTGKESEVFFTTYKQALTNIEVSRLKQVWHGYRALPSSNSRFFARKTSDGFFCATGFRLAIVVYIVVWQNTANCCPASYAALPMRTSHSTNCEIY